MVFVYVFLPTLIIGMLVLYKAGKLTSDKMELQNAADAAAYSISVVEARDLNFASYMNRSIVANEVAVGQLIGVASWAIHWRSFHDYLKLYSIPLSVPPITPIGRGFDALAKFFKFTGDKVKPHLLKVADKGIQAVNILNKIYGGAEYAFHLASTMYALGQVQTIISQNGPAGARLSEFGLLSLIGHLSTFGSIPGLPGEKFTKVYNPKAKTTLAAFKNDKSGSTDAGGFGRLAALIHGSADPFVNTRGWYFDFFKSMHKAGLIPNFLYLERGTHTSGRLKGQPKGQLGFDTGNFTVLDIAVAKVRARIWLMIHMGLSREGGSELRLMVPVRGRDRSNAAGTFFNWSAADTTSLVIEPAGGFYVDGKLCDPTGLLGCTGWGRIIGGSLTARNNNLKIKFSFAGIKVTLLNTPFPTDVPFGAAFAQAGHPASGSGKKALTDTFIASNKKQIGTTTSLTRKGPLPPDSYGGASKSLLAWEFPVPPGVFYQAGMADRKVNKTYSGLPTFVDTSLVKPLQGSGGPNIVLGVTLEAGFDQASNGSQEIEPTGRFKIDEAMAGNQLHALAKAEVYFKRPTDLSYYLRLDGQEEIGSAFNPYWSARLVETSHADRAVALGLQQGVDAGGGTPYTISSLFAPVISALGF